MKKILGIVGFLVVVGLVTVGVALYARGYRPNLQNGSVDSTGIVSIRSNPDGATVYVDGDEKGTTDLDLSSLKPGTYTVRMEKDGFSNWEEEVEIRKEEVNVVYAVLFPKAPSLRALTFTGVERPVYSAQNGKVVYSITSPEDEAGIWVLNLSTSPLPSFFTKDITRLVADTQDVTFSQKSYEFSPDGGQILIHNGTDGSYYLVNTSDENQTPKEVTLDIEQLRAGWEEEETNLEQSAIGALGEEAEALASTLTEINVSPEKEKFFGVRENGTYLLFDSNPGVAPTEESQTYNLPQALSYYWYPDGDYLILVRESSVSIYSVDNQNEVTLFTENFEPPFAAVWPDGSKIVILTSFNSTASQLPNLYAIELR